MTDRARVLLADDNDHILEMWRSVLSADFHVVEAVRDGAALVEAARRLAPDVVVTDISMPGLGGIAAAERILQETPAVRVVFATVHAEAAMVERCLAIGALGYVVKTGGGVHLVPAVHAALRGERYVSLTSGAPPGGDLP